MGAGQETITYPGKRIVRVIGTVLITACCVLVVLGLTVWSEQLKGPRYVIYWSWCFLLLLITMLTALVDAMMIRRTSRQTRRELLRKQFTKPRSD